MRSGQRTRGAVTALAVGFGLMLTGCSHGGTDAAAKPAADPTTSIQAAKADARRAERALLRLVPEDRVTNIDQHPTGSLVTCGEHQKQWAGSTRFSVGGDLSREDLIDEIERAAAEHGFRVEQDLAIDGSPRLQVHRDRSASMLVGTTGTGSQMKITSFSRCFAVPEDFIPDPSY